jgi:hypothetical protein
MDIVEKSNRTTLRRIEDNDPKLTSLSIVDRGHTTHNPEECFWVQDGADLSRLGNAIANNTNLKKISLYRSSEWTSQLDANALFEGLQQSTTIKKLSLHGSIGIGILNEFVANSSSIIDLIIQTCDLGDGVARALSQMITKCPNVDKIFIINCKFDDASLKDLALGIRG